MEFVFSLFKLFMDGKGKEYVKWLERISPFKSWHELKDTLLLVFAGKMILMKLG